MSIYFSTDFETTYAPAFSTVIAKIYHPNEYLHEYVRSYVDMCSFGCDADSKRVVLEKIDICDEHNVYN